MSKLTKGIVLASAAAAMALAMTGCASHGGVGLSCRHAQAGCKGMNHCKGRASGSAKDMHRNSCSGKNSCRGH